MTETKEILNNLNWRYATKQFDASRKLSDEQTAFLQETLRLTPSSFGFQPWKFIFVTDPAVRKRLREKAWGQAQVEDAAALIVLCRQAALEQSDVDKLVSAKAESLDAPAETLGGFKDMLSGFVGNLSAEAAGGYMANQVHIALGYLLFACAQAGIDACPMGGFEPEAFDEILGLKDKGLRSVVLCAVGHRAESDKYASQPKVRYPLADAIESY